MRAAYFEEFQGPITLRNVPDPDPAPGGVVIKVKASGLCRSDWHGWMGHDPDIRLPHVPGHELAGTIAALGQGVRGWSVGDRVTLPFCCGCGTCGSCAKGQTQICDAHFQPGFTAFGSFAPYVAIPYADVNLVAVPAAISDSVAAILGCRFVTSYRAVVDRGRVQPGQWLAVHGCGGVGLSAIMIAKSLGARVVAVDVDHATLELAKSLGADACIHAAKVDSVWEAVREVTQGGAHVSLDALGSPVCAHNSVLSLAKQGIHVQVGLLPGGATPLPMDAVIGRELELSGSHGLSAQRYPEVLDLIAKGRVQPERLMGRELTLDELPEALATMDKRPSNGVSVVTSF